MLSGASWQARWAESRTKQGLDLDDVPALGFHARVAANYYGVLLWRGNSRAPAVKKRILVRIGEDNR